MYCLLLLESRVLFAMRMSADSVSSEAKHPTFAPAESADMRMASIAMASKISLPLHQFCMMDQGVYNS